MPSLFDEEKLIEIEGLLSMTDAFLADASKYIAQPEKDVALVLRHGGGVRGKNRMDAIKSSGWPVRTASREKGKPKIQHASSRNSRRTAAASKRKPSRPSSLTVMGPRSLRVEPWGERSPPSGQNAFPRNPEQHSGQNVERPLMFERIATRVGSLGFFTLVHSICNRRTADLGPSPPAAPR